MRIILSNCAANMWWETGHETGAVTSHNHSCQIVQTKIFRTITHHFKNWGTKLSYNHPRQLSLWNLETCSFLSPLSPLWSWFTSVTFLPYSASATAPHPASELHPGQSATWVSEHGDLFWGSQQQWQTSTASILLVTVWTHIRQCGICCIIELNSNLLNTIQVYATQ